MPTHRTAKAVIRNNTQEPMTAVSLIHKYSDVFKNKDDWGLIKHGATSSTLDCDFNTGAFTTGRDWWMITWFRKDMKRCYYSDPDNMRSVIDVMEGLTPGIMTAAAAAFSAGEGPGAIAAATAVANGISSKLTNSETTAGFKQHILRSEDEGETTVITVEKDHTITFKSPSGDSETRFNWREVE